MQSPAVAQAGRQADRHRDAQAKAGRYPAISQREINGLYNGLLYLKVPELHPLHVSACFPTLTYRSGESSVAANRRMVNEPAAHSRHSMPVGEYNPVSHTSQVEFARSSAVVG